MVLLSYSEGTMCSFCEFPIPVSQSSPSAFKIELIVVLNDMNFQCHIDTMIVVENEKCLPSKYLEEICYQVAGFV